MRFAAALLFAALALSACTREPHWASDEEIARVRYSGGGTPKLTLLTMVSNSTGSGAHSALMINASERVIFDPAGTVNEKKLIPERNDVLFGINPKVEQFFIRSHARLTYHVIIQEIDVSPEVAELALRTVKDYGAVYQGYCSQSTSEVLSRLPGFQSIRPTLYPNKLADQFDTIPGVKRTELYEYDDADKSAALEAWDPEKFRKTYQNQ